MLDTLADSGELGTNEIARRTGMTPSTVSRQLGTLAASGLVERVDATGRYRLGIRLVHLANAVLARLDVREVARPHLVALVEATGETATLSVPGDDDAITVDFVPGAHQIQPVSRLGRPSIAHATSARLEHLDQSLADQPVTRQHLADLLRKRSGKPGITITIGNEHADPRLENFTVVTSEYRSGSLAGVIGVIGPTRMPYEKVISLVRHTSRLVSALID